MKERFFGCCSVMNVLVAAILGAITSARGAEGLPEALFPGVRPVCECEGLTNLVVGNARVESAAMDPTNGFCRVTAVVAHPGAEGDRVRIWIALPVTNWNGRFRGHGGGGYAGGSPGSLPGAARQGYAAGATDTGHEGGSGKFALDENGRLNWHTIQDNAYLGIHEMTVVGKALTKAFYGKEPRYSYFVGSSSGGRQGLMEAQRYPEDRRDFVGLPGDQLAKVHPGDSLAAGGDGEREELRGESEAGSGDEGGDRGVRRRGWSEGWSDR